MKGYLGAFCIVKNLMKFFEKLRFSKENKVYAVNIIMYKILVKIWMVKGYCDVVSDANEEHAVGQQRTVCPCNLVKHLAKLCSFSSVW